MPGTTEPAFAVPFPESAPPLHPTDLPGLNQRSGQSGPQASPIRASRGGGGGVVSMPQGRLVLPVQGGDASCWAGRPDWAAQRPRDAGKPSGGAPSHSEARRDPRRRSDQEQATGSVAKPVPAVAKCAVATDAIRLRANAYRAVPVESSGRPGGHSRAGVPSRPARSELAKLHFTPRFLVIDISLEWLNSFRSRPGTSE